VYKGTFVSGIRPSSIHEKIIFAADSLLEHPAGRTGGKNPDILLDTA
jgi:hypothetical protein